MILKSGAFNLICERYKVNKLNPNSHLYTSDTLIDFPGRIFSVSNVVNYRKKTLKKLTLKQANITTRNFPFDVKEIRKISGLKDGGDDYLFFTTNNLDELILIQTKKIN